VIPADVCQAIIAKFDSDERRHPGITGAPETGGGVYPQIKSSTDLNISRLAEEDDSWQAYAQALTNGYMSAVARYGNDVPSTRYLAGNLGITGFQIQRYKMGNGHYVEHIDANSPVSSGRVLSGVFYLNTVDEGGETWFPYQEVKVKPVQGSIVLFPANFAYPHKALVPMSGPKYIVATWLAFVMGAQAEARKTGYG
jgi:hypothetical protein